MGIQEAKSRIRRASSTYPGLIKGQLVELSTVLQILDEELKGSLEWSIQDFESVARGREVLAMEEAGEDSILIDQVMQYLVPVPEKYLFFDRALFQGGFDLMMRKHDASVGINWDVIEHYLNKYCLLAVSDEPVISKSAEPPGHPPEEEMEHTAMDFLSRAGERSPEAPGDAPPDHSMAGGLRPSEVSQQDISEGEGRIYTSLQQGERAEEETKEGDTQKT